jgi:hypothetical protein
MVLISDSMAADTTDLLALSLGHRYVVIYYFIILNIGLL